MIAAIGPDDIEAFRPLLPVGYAAGVAAYRQAVAELTPRDLSEHYRAGQAFFHERFVPHVKGVLRDLSGGAWNLDEHAAYAAGSDVDLMTHVIDGVAATEPVRLFPGDWFGFRVGASQQANILWDSDGSGGLVCLCVPSVRNGHLTDEMCDFLNRADAALLNLNLFPTLAEPERRSVARRLAPLLDRSLLSISFSRGFGLTASQLGVLLVPRNHPLRHRFHGPWEWFTYFYNALAARAFMLLDVAELQRIDEQRRAWVAEWLLEHDLPALRSGTYYVKSFRSDDLPSYFAPLQRNGLVRLCFKPPFET